MRIPTLLFRLSFYALALLSLSQMVFAQQFAGTLRGTVRDAQGAVVPGADVTISNQETGVAITLATNSDGSYVAPQLSPGTYKITIRKSGFKAATLADVKLDVQQIREADVTLDVGQTSETVSVSASGTSAVETTSSTVSQTIDQKRIVDLPLNGRNPFSL
ncbi:MAG: carboxypeptidase-like regulatory domain-containing protein, partial [Blastocatellia bacterium]